MFEESIGMLTDLRAEVEKLQDDLEVSVGQSPHDQQHSRIHVLILAILETLIGPQDDD
jgi:hypothetical protein